MENNQLNSPKVFSHKGQGKDKHFQAQMQIWKIYLQKLTPRTAYATKPLLT